MKQRRLKTKVGRDGSDRDSKWAIRLVAVVVAIALCGGPLLARPISTVDAEDEKADLGCVLSAHDWWVYEVSEMLRALGLMNARSRFVFAFLKNGLYECTG